MDQETQIHKIIAGLFGIASGSDLLTAFTDFVDANDTQTFATTVAGFLPEATTEERTDALASNFGFVNDPDNPDSPGSLGYSYISNTLGNGVNAGQVVFNIVTFLSLENLADDFPDFVPSANLLANKAAIADLYSDNFPSGDDLAALAVPLSGDIPTDSLLDAAGAEAELNEVGLSLPTTFTLTSAANSVTEGGALTFTVTSSEAVTEDTDVVFTVVPGDTEAADQGTNTTNLNDFVTGTFNPVTVTIPAGQTTATFTVTGADDSVTELPETYSVQAAVDGATLTQEVTLEDAENNPITVLTTGSDNIPGTTGNDTITGVVDSVTATSNTFGAADTINGGDGTGDIINIIIQNITGATTLVAAAVSNVENVNIRNVDPTPDTVTVNGTNFVGHTALNADRSSAATTFTNVAADASVGIIGNAAVTNGATTATWAATATAPVVNISGGTLGAGAVGLTAAGAASLTLNSTGAANAVGAITTASTGILTTTINAATSLATGGLAIGTNAAAQSLVVSGAATGVAATATAAATSAVVLGALDADFASIDASGMTAGGVSGTLSATVAATFTGGAGQDMVTTSTSGQTGAVNAGGGDNDILTLANATHIDTTAEGAIYQGFEILSSAAAAIDMDLITGSTITGIQVGAAGSNVTDMNATQAANVQVIGALGATTLGIKDATMVGTNDTLALTISDGDTTTGEALVVGGDLTLAGVETVTIDAIDGGTFTTMANITGMNSMTVTGGGNVSFTTGAHVLESNASFNFSALTGTSTFNAAAATTNAFAFTGGTGIDTVTDNVIGGNVINTGDGNDVITLTDKTGGTSTTNVTGGAGADATTTNMTGNVARDLMKFNYAAGDSVSDSSATGISATLTDTIANLDGATLSATAGASAEFDTEVQATAITFAANVAPTFGTTTVTNGGDFYVNIVSATVTNIFQDTDGDGIIESGEFAVSLTGIQTDTLLNADFTIVSGDLILITT